MSFDISGKDNLMDAGRHLPPASLRERSPFVSQAAYLDYLAETHATPDAYWRAIARRAGLLDPTAAPRGQGLLRSIGAMNLARACLAPHHPQPPERSVLLLAPSRDGVDRVPLARLEGMAGATARRLREWDLAPGSPVMIAGEADHAMIAAAPACLNLGLAVVPIERKTPVDRIADRYRATDCRGLISGFDAGISVPDGRVVTLDASLGEAPLPDPTLVEATAPAFIFAEAGGHRFTVPAGGFLLQAMAAYHDLLGGSAADGPLWVLGGPRMLTFFAATLGALASGDPVGLLVPEPGRPAAVLRDAMIGAGVSRILADSGTILDLPASQDDLPGDAGAGPGPALLFLEGEAILPADWRAARRAIAGAVTHAVQLLARPEAGGFIAGPCPFVSPVREASVGSAAPGIALSVVDRDGAACQRGIGGFLALSAPTPGLAIELSGSPAPILLEVKARRDSSGDLWTMGEALVSRPSDPSVSLSELETFVAALPDVDQVAIIRYQEQDGTARIRAFVKPAEGTAEAPLVDSIRKGIAARFGDRAAPDSFQVVGQLPRSRSGKLLRSVLRRISSGEPLVASDTALLTEPGVLEDLTRSR